MSTPTPILGASELGKQSDYDAHYSPDKLFAIPRQSKRDEIGVPEVLPFLGFDRWNHYEVSWLNEKGKPVVAIAEITYGCETACIIESKSMKLYFNSFNNSTFKDKEAVRTLVENDIQSRIGGPVTATITLLNEMQAIPFAVNFSGECLDELDIACEHYQIDASFLQTENEIVEETLHSNLLKSNCLVTNQPDWASVQITYRGKKIQREGLLRYLVSFRNHNEFHEQCIERIFMDIMTHCQPEVLTIDGRYTRRGGLDINPYRTTDADVLALPRFRLCRQ